MADKHTPLPWKFVPWHIEEGPSAVRAPIGHLVCTTASDADAQLIVKAVNNHEAMDKLLAAAADELNNIPRMRAMDLGHKITQFRATLQKQSGGDVGGAGDRS